MKLSYISRGLVAALLALTTGNAPAFTHGDHERNQPHWQEATGWPDRIITTLPGDPAHSFAVSWRTNTDVTVGLSEIVLASEVARFDLAAKTVKGETTALNLTSLQTAEGIEIPEIHNAGLPVVNYHSVTFDGLEPDTLYAYRVRGEIGKWSAWRHY